MYFVQDLTKYKYIVLYYTKYMVFFRMTQLLLILNQSCVSPEFPLPPPFALLPDSKPDEYVRKGKSGK